MIIKLKGADFSTNNINALLNSYFVSITGGSCVTATTSISSISKDTPTYSNTFTVNTDYSVSNVEVTMGGSVVSGAASATTGEAGTAITISVPTVTGNISIKFTYTYNGGTVEPEDPDTPTVTSVLLDEYTDRKLSGGSYGAGGLTYGIQTNLTSGTYISCIDFMATQGGKYSNPTEPITTGKISIYEIDSSGKLTSLLAEVESATSFVSEEEATNGIHVYRVNIGKTVTNPNIAVSFIPTDTSNAPTAAYATGGSPALGPCYFGNIKALGDTVTYNQSNYYLPFVLYK